MGAILSPSTRISGAAGNPGIPFSISPTSGFYITPMGGLGFSLSGGAYMEVNSGSGTLGPRVSSTFGLSIISTLVVAGISATAISPDGAHLYYGTNAAIYGFTRNKVTGALTAIPGSPWSEGGAIANAPQSMVFSADGLTMYATNTDGGAIATVSGFSRNPITGALTLLAGAPYGGQASQWGAISPDGLHYYHTQSATGINIFSRNSAGVLAAIGQVGAGCNGGIAISPDGLFVYACNGSLNNQVQIFSRNPATGLLTAAGTINSASAAFSIAISFDGTKLVIGDNGANTVNTYLRNVATGALALADTKAVGVNPRVTIFSPDGAYIYSVCFNSNTIYPFSVNSATGVMTALATLVTGSLPFGLAISPDGYFLGIGNAGDPSLKVIQTAVLPRFPLINYTYDPYGGGGGSININGQLTVQGSAVNITPSSKGAVLAGAGNWAVPSGITQCKVTIVGGGGGGAGSGTPGATNGGAGGNTVFGAFTANGGAGSVFGALIGGAGGTIVGAPSVSVAGQTGFSDAAITPNGISGSGGSTPLGFGGASQMMGGGAGLAGTGAGGGGAGGSPLGANIGQPGGGAGGYAVNFYSGLVPGALIAYSVGAGGTAGAAGTGGTAGGAGAPGTIIIEF